jgi:hypothetical protein
VDHSLILISTRALWTITLTLSQTIADPTSWRGQKGWDHWHQAQEAKAEFQAQQ